MMGGYGLTGCQLRGLVALLMNNRKLMIGVLGVPGLAAQAARPFSFGPACVLSPRGTGIYGIYNSCMSTYASNSPL